MGANDDLNYLNLITGLARDEQFPPITPEKYWASAELRERVARIMQQPAGWVLVVTPRSVTNQRGVNP